MGLISRGALLLLAAASMLGVDGQTAPVCANSADCGPMGQCVHGQHGQHCSYLSTGTASETASRRFKYIVVGGGAAGCAAAATLAAHGATLLIERGDRKELYPSTRNMAAFDAIFTEGPFMEALTTSDGTRVARPRVLGGGTAINVGIYNRDTADTAVGIFARLGYDMVKMEAAYNWTESVLRPEPALAPMSDSYAAGLRAAFLADDANMTNHSTPSISLAPGIFQPYTTLPGGQSGRNRTSADMLVRQANLNLTILLNSAVTRVVFDPSKRAVGVEFRSQGALYRVFVEDGDGEVVLAAGAMATPVLLMASGIGPSGHLSDHGIATVVDSPTVGTLTDPAMVMFGMVGWRDEVLTPRTPAFLLTLPGSGVAVEAFTGEQAMRGLLLSSCGLLPREQRTDAACDAAAQWMATRSNLNQDLSSVTAVGVKLLGPSSRGSVRLSSSSAEDRPIVTTGFFSVESDLALLATGLRRVIQAAESDHMAPYRASRLPTMMALLFGADSDVNASAGGTGQRPYLPATLPAASDNDTVLQDWCREYAVTMYHQSGTTAGAIDANFSIAGVAGLRVADASALTKLPGTHPMASVMALGRYAAQSIVSTPLGSSGTISPADFPVPSSSADDSDDALAVVGAVLGSVVAVLLVGVAATKYRTSGKDAPSRPPRRLSLWAQMASAPSIDERAVWGKSKMEQTARVNLAERTGRGSRTVILLKTAVALAGISVEPNSILLKDVSAFTRDKKDKRQVNAVLQNISAFIGAEHVTALIGPSGSGKSTLLNYLAFGKSYAHFEGSVKFGGKPLLDWRKSNRVGYVPQHSLFVPVLTALEHLTYQAALRLPHADQALREKEALKALSVVGLAQSKHIKCGGVLAGGFTIKGLSGGQQRLLSIATVLMENNPILMLDEPTSGLDSHHAFSVMLCLRMLASMGHTVLLSIHQPSKELWDMVDDTVVMSCGRCVFSGPTPKLMPWFELHGFASLPSENPVDFVIGLVTTGINKPQLLYGDNTLRSNDDVSALALNFRHVHIASQLWAGLRDAVRSRRWRARLDMLPPTPDRDEREQPREKRAGWFRQVGVLCGRQCLLTVRNPGDALSRLICYFGIGLLGGFVFAQVDAVQSWYGLMFWTVRISTRSHGRLNPLPPPNHQRQAWSLAPLA